MRRFFAILVVGLLALGLAQAQKEPCAVAGNNNDFLGIQTIRLGRATRRRPRARPARIRPR